MAADTAAKRASAINMMAPMRNVGGMLPVGTSTAGSRAASLWLYSGIGGGAAASSSPGFKIWVGMGIRI